MRIALFYGHYSSNIGDVAINSGVAQLLKNIFGSKLRLKVFFLNGDGCSLNGRESFACVSNCEFERVDVSATLAIKYLCNPDLFLVDCGVSCFDLILVNGGEHLFSYQKNKNWLNLYWRALPALSASLNSVNCAILPSSFGPFECEDSLVFAKESLRAANGWACRDQESAFFLESYGFPGKHLVMLDVAFFNESLPSVSEEGLLGIAVRSDNFGLRLGEQVVDDYNYTETLSYTTTLNIASEYLCAGVDRRVIIFVQTNSDFELSTALYTELIISFGADRVALARPKSVQEYISFLGRCECIYTSRFHAAILAWVAGTPVVAAYFDEHGHKMPGMFSFLGRGSLCFSLRHCDERELAAEVVAGLKFAIKDFDSLRAHLDSFKSDVISWLKAESLRTVSLSERYGSSGYSSVWQEIISVSEAKKIQVSVSAKNTRETLKKTS